MGGSAWSGDAYKNLRTSYSTKSTDDIFKSNKTKTTDNLLDPKGVKFREARDSDVHPLSLGIEVNLDVTGSMGKIPEILIREKLGMLMETLIKHGVPDAAIMFNAIGDHYSDRAPLQVGQFESGTTELNEYLSKIFIEGNGGGQNMESYMLAWLFGARHTSMDCFEKRGEKGFLFTIGDEWVHSTLEAAAVEKILGYGPGEDLHTESLLKEAQRTHEVFHLYVAHHGKSWDDDILPRWKNLMGERVIMVEDYNNIAEIIATTVAVVRGAKLHDVVSGFDDNTAKAVTNALVKVQTGVVKHAEGIVNL